MIVQNINISIHSSIDEQSQAKIKRGIWIYFFLLIFEGALRKWVLPSLATPLLVVRDPVAIWLLFMGWKKGFLSRNVIAATVMTIGVISIFTAFYLGHGNLTVAIYGSRILLLHFPLIFVIGKVFNYADVLRIGKICLWISIPMTLLITLQFYSPQDAWINRGIGGDIKGGGFTGVMGYFRPPGTFSFTTGVSQFFSLTAAFVSFFWLRPTGVKRMMIILTTLCILASIPLSISRGLLFSVLVTLFFGGVILLRKPQYLLQSLVALVLLGYSVVFLGETEDFQTITQVFTARFNLANSLEGGLQGVFLDRFLGGMIDAFSNSAEEPFFGYGSGMGTNVGSMLLTGKQLFLISEGEWGRLIGELGFFFGIVIIFLRLLFCVQLAVASYSQISKANILPWMLSSFALFIILQGQWAQPTTLGFSVMIGGLVLAAMNKDSHTENNVS